MCKRLCPLLVCSSLLPCFCSVAVAWLWPLLLPLPFAITLVPVLALAFALAFTGDVFDVHRTSHRVWRLCVGFVSERLPMPMSCSRPGRTGGRYAIGCIYPRTVKCSPANRLCVSAVRPRSPDLYIVACFSYTQLVVPTTSTDLRTLPGDLPSLAAAQTATSRIKSLQDSNPFLSGTRCTSHKLRPVVTLSPTRRTERGSRFEWSRMTRRSRLECSLWTLDSASRRSATHLSPSSLRCQMEQASLPTSTSLTLQSSYQNLISTSSSATMHKFCQ